MQKPQSTQTANLIEDPSETFKNSENEHRFCFVNVNCHMTVRGVLFTIMLILKVL